MGQLYRTQTNRYLPTNRGTGHAETLADRDARDAFLSSPPRPTTRAPTDKMWSARSPNDPAIPPNEDVADVGIADAGADPPRGRPVLARDEAAVPPPAPAPPQSSGPPGSMTVQQATDSLSLIQLRRLVNDMRQADPVAYDFTYSDTGPHGEEIDEWFVYMVWQWIRLNGIQRTFEWQWQEE
ncbi:hypothetical protein IMZ48_08490, partial [Candidatus Bathyarchaeota archaeon]|nr:hypothetical protein [Candidatus Bathyarchaeota archaeon]